MDPTAKPVVMFVAMPYTDMGDKASWKDPIHVEKFYARAGPVTVLTTQKSACSH